MTPARLWRRLVPDNLTETGRHTFRYHLRAAILEGAWNGVFLTNDIVARKTLGASAFWITVLVTAPAVAMLFSIFWTHALVGRDKRRWFLYAGIFGRLVVILFAFGTGPATFTGLITWTAFSASLILPLQNAVYQANYSVVERGRLFGITASVSAMTAVAVSFGTGLLYNRWPESYRVIYPVAGLLGFLSCVQFYRVRVRAVEGDARPAGRGNFLAEAWSLLRADRYFARYEASFMIYGTAFMLLQPILPLFLVDELGADYRQAAQAKAVIFQLTTVFFSPFWGRMLDRADPVRLVRWIFASLALFPLLLLASRELWTVYIAYFLFGFSMAGLNVCWTLGPIHFAGARDSSGYMGIHVTLAGVRGAYAHWLGYLLLNLAGGSYVFPFAISASLFLVATLIAVRLRGTMSRAGVQVSPARPPGAVEGPPPATVARE